MKTTAIILMALLLIAALNATNHNSDTKDSKRYADAAMIISIILSIAYMVENY